MKSLHASRRYRPSGLVLACAVLIGALGATSRPAQAQTMGAGSSAAATSPAVTPGTGAINETAGAKGAKMYCFMRNAGNTHKVSWEAAYALIKRQKDSLFKTSPENAAVMITEAVVDNPSAFPDCAKYLGDLYIK